jgi:alpha,alpha-trehalose phosphorylase
MRDHDGSLSFTPRLPQRLTRLAFGMCFRDRRLKVEVTHGEARYWLAQGPPLQITHHGKTINIRRQKPVSCPIPEIAAGDAPRQPPGRSPTRRGTPG